MSEAGFRRASEAMGHKFHPNAPIPPFVSLTPLQEFVGKLSQAKAAFYNIRKPARSIKIAHLPPIDLANWARGVVFVRWDVESARMYAQRVVFQAAEDGLYYGMSTWADLEETMTVLRATPTLNFDQADWISVQYGSRAWTLDSLDPSELNPALEHAWKQAMTPGLVPSDIDKGIQRRDDYKTLVSNYSREDIVRRSYPQIPLLQAEIYRGMVEFTGASKKKSVLDVGCGTGAYGSLFCEDRIGQKDPSRDLWNVYFVDSGAYFVEYTRDHVINHIGCPPDGTSAFQVADFTSPSERTFIKTAFKKKEGFDFVFASHVLNHLKFSCLPQSLNSLLDLCAPGGFVVFDFDLPSEYQRPGQYLLIPAGIREVDVSPLRRALVDPYPRLTMHGPTLEGAVLDKNGDKKLGIHWIHDSDLERGRNAVEEVVKHIPNAKIENCGLKVNTKRYIKDHKSVDRMKAKHKTTGSEFRRRDYGRVLMTDDFKASTSGEIRREEVWVEYMVRLRKDK